MAGTAAMPLAVVTTTVSKKNREQLVDSMQSECVADGTYIFQL